MSKQWNDRMRPRSVLRTAFSTGGATVALSLLVACRQESRIVDNRMAADTTDFRVATVTQPANANVVSSARTVRPVRATRPIEISAEGVVTYDTRQLSVISSRVAGRVERLYVHALFESVRRGQPLFSIYSPELVAAQHEFLYVLQVDSGNAPLIAAATNKLRLLGVTETQIARLRQRRDAELVMMIPSPETGYVIGVFDTPTNGSMLGAGVSPTSAMGESTMESGAIMGSSDRATVGLPSSPPASAAGDAFPLREGQYVARGQTVFRVVNPAYVWVELRVPLGNAGIIRPGMPVTLTFDQLARPEVDARVLSIVPIVDSKQPYVTARVALSRTQAAPIGQLARGLIHAPAQTALWIPASAVLDLGNRQVAFQKVGAAFRPVTVTTGMRTNGMVAIQAGLVVTDEIAEQAQLLVDSEGFVAPSSMPEHP